MGTIVTEDDKHLVNLTVSKEDGGKFGALISTVTHPFRSHSRQGWIEAGDLAPGDTLHTPNGTTGRGTVPAGSGIRPGCGRRWTRGAGVGVAAGVDVTCITMRQGSGALCSEKCLVIPTVAREYAERAPHSSPPSG